MSETKKFVFDLGDAEGEHLKDDDKPLRKDEKTPSSTSLA